MSAVTLGAVGMGVAALLTLAILSRVVAENPFSRLAQHLFVGVAAGYAVGMVWLHILWPRLQLLLTDPPGHWHLALFFALGLLLLGRGLRPAWPVGDAAVSVMLGVGAGLALVGTIKGTLGPQLSAAVVQPQLASPKRLWAATLSALIVALCTLLTLAAFHHTQRESGILGWLDRLTHGLGAVGRRLLMLAFGTVLAGAWLAFFAALQGRLAFLYNALRGLMGALGWSI